MLYLGILPKLVIFAGIITFVIFKYLKNKRMEESLILFGSCTYLVLLLEIVIFPIRYDFPLPDFKLTFNLIPLKTVKEMTIFGFGIFLRQIVGNIVLFIPMGFFAPVLSKKFASFKSIIGFCIVISSGIEIIQGVINVLTQYYNRSVDIDDLILNTLGAAIGFLIFELLKPIVHKLFPNLVCCNLTDKV